MVIAVKEAPMPTLAFQKAVKNTAESKYALTVEWCLSARRNRRSSLFELLTVWLRLKRRLSSEAIRHARSKMSVTAAIAMMTTSVPVT
jgi:hypothetical protein